ncbi:rhamnogalacturonan acetylesterase [Adhaeretor mobilis]|uniref:Rhamnogalacturonan acetylesterase RhgT n=1 Tax=Adhaeretor mobilis TaxID=1930276 RepID=A0A517MRE1_9BACT|nr:rhamnogalacturonan acetylesterase [Adhaeretor mobilis]QDS97367.1 Rhamnogalacturonan acetylesterase RhgT [Adhaeretor mobilis]
MAKSIKPHFSRIADPKFSVPVAMLLLLSALPMVAHGDEASKVLIVLAGDSTVTDHAGWGRGFADSYGPGVKVINSSVGGRSSKSFRDEGLWHKAINAKPDYVLIQFGHNDQSGKGPERETDPETTYRVNMTRYVDEVIAMGGQPVLVTSISRRLWSEDGKIRSTLTPYAEVVRKIAVEKKVPLIDLHPRSIKVYEALGRAACLTISPKEDGKVDATHLNTAGGQLFGPMVAEDLQRVVPQLSQFFLLQD